MASFSMVGFLILLRQHEIDMPFFKVYDPKLFSILLPEPLIMTICLLSLAFNRLPGSPERKNWAENATTFSVERYYGYPPEKFFF